MAAVQFPSVQGLHSVLVPLPGDGQLSRPDRVQLQREASRVALRTSAELSGAAVDSWPQRDDGVPLPVRGWHWSVSHTRRWAAAVVARYPIGVDIEWIRPRTESLWDGVADGDEWQRLGERNWNGFFRLWTAKEATLKAHGSGIGYLREVRVSGTAGPAALVVEFRGKVHRVLQLRLDDQIAAVSPASDRVEWTILVGRTVLRAT